MHVACTNQPTYQLTVIFDRSINGIVNDEKTNFRHSPIDAKNNIMITYDSHERISIYDKCHDLTVPDTDKFICMYCRTCLASSLNNVYAFGVDKYYCRLCKHKAPMVIYIYVKTKTNWYKLRESITKNAINIICEDYLFKYKDCWFVTDDIFPSMYLHENTHVCTRL